MIKVSILYANKEDGRFDMDYYCKVHMPMSIEKLGKTLRGVIVEQGLSGVLEGSKPEYIAMCHFFFDSIEAFVQAFLPHAELLQGDIKNYTDIEPVIQYSEVKIHL